MRDHGDETESTVSRDGITVYQTYEEERFGVPTVVLKFVSDREEPAEVRVAVDLPPDLHIEEVGFHPDYRREDWTVDSDRLEFAAEIRPGEEVTTMYAVESLAADQLDSLLDNLTIERVAGEAADAGAADSGFDPHPARRSERTASETATGSASADDLKAQVETHPAVDDEGATADSVDFDDPPAETADAADEPAGDRDGDGNGDTAPESVEADAGTETEDGDGDGADTDPAGGAAEDDEPLDALGLAEIDDSEAVETGGDERDQDEETITEQRDHGEPPAEDVETSDAGDEDESTDDADERGDEETGADRAGTAGRATLSDYSTAELVAELDQRVEAGGFTDEDRGRLYELLLGESDGATVSDELRVAHLQKRVSDLEAGMEAINEFDARHGPPAEAFAKLEADVATLGERVDTIVREVSSTADQVERLAPRLDDIEDDVDSLAEGQDALESEVSALREWRERVKSTLQALGDQ